MVHYSYKPVASQLCARAKQDDLKVHYKNTYETASAIRGMRLKRAKRYLHSVLNHRKAIPFTIHTGGIGRNKQARHHKTSQCRWPRKSCLAILKILQNAEANAKKKKLRGALYIRHIEVLKASKIRRRTYRAHGRINPFMYSPCHVQVILEETRTKRKTQEPPAKRASASRAVERAAAEGDSSGDSDDDDMPDLEEAPDS